MSINYNNNYGVELLSSTPNPNKICYLALHQCYSSDPVKDDLESISRLSESTLGERLVNKCIQYGHWSVVEQAYFSFNVWGFPHDVLVQARTHRHLSFSAQSQRYTFKKIFDYGNNYLLYDHASYDDLQDLFYFREPDQKYLDREGNKYFYSQKDFEQDVLSTFEAVIKFTEKIQKGYAPEHARQLLPQNLRQHFVLGCNARALLHFCDLRLPKDAQREIRDMAQCLFSEFRKVMPELAQWYETNRYGKSKLSP